MVGNIESDEANVIDVRGWAVYLNRQKLNN